MSGPDPGRPQAGPDPDRPPEDVDELLTAAAHGDDSAFELALARLSGPIHRLVATMVRDPAQAEEVTQEVAFEMWRTRVRYDSGKGSAAAWAMTIARRRAIDRVRAMTASSAREQRTIMANRSCDPVRRDQVSEAVEENLNREQLYHCLERLSRPQQQAIVLAFFGGYAHAEIARLQGLPLGTVKARIRGGLASLRLCMRASGPPRPGVTGPGRERSRTK
jgi:RNA polymerase sigma-70 factor (ECF subfamily)